MAIEQRRYLYEILVRFDENGLKGIHAKDLEEIVNEGVVLSAKESPARPVTEQELTDLMAARDAQATLQISELLKEIETLKKEV